MTQFMLTLMQLGFIIALITVALEVPFSTNLFKKYLGNGVNGDGEGEFFKGFELRPWISMAVGLLVAFFFHIQAIKTGLGSEFLGKDLSTDAVIIDQFLTGLVLGGGPKTLKAFGRIIKETKKGLS